MELKKAKASAEELLRPFVGQVLTTEVLNSIEDTVNDLIYVWAQERFFVRDEQGMLVKGIKVWYDVFDGSLRIAYRYPVQ